MQGGITVDVLQAKDRSTLGSSRIQTLKIWFSLAGY
jgi:hypothetical protein